MEAMRMEVSEVQNNSHDIPFDNAPTCFEKDPRKSIGAGCLITRHLLDRDGNLFLREGVRHGFQAWVVEVNPIPIKVNRAHFPLPHDRTKVVEDDLFFSLVIGDPPIAVLDTLNEVFSSSSIDPKVEELGVCIALLNVSNAGTLLFSCQFLIF
jgi:hypothetical protein